MRRSTVSGSLGVVGHLGAGDRDGLRLAVGELLDRGDMAAILGAMSQAEERLGEDATDLLDATVEREAQRADCGGVEAALFCLPLLVDPRRCGPMPAGAVREALSADGERFLLASGWAHVEDLLELDAAGYRGLVRHLARDAEEGAASLDLPREAFPRYPVADGDAEGGTETWGASGRACVAPRFVFGLLLRAPGAPTGGVVHSIAQGGLDPDRAEALSAALLAAVPGATAALEPGQPIFAAVGAAASVECVALRAALEAAAARLGRKPITHFCVDDDALLLAMTSDGAQVVDTFGMCLLGADPDQVRAIVADLSRGLVLHEAPEGMPAAPRPTAH